MSAADPGAARRHLELLHGRSPGLISIVSRADGWKGRRFSSVTAAADHAAALAQAGHDVYAGCATLARDPEQGRGSAADTLALPGFWLDIDLGTVGHKPAPNGLPNPPDEGSALSIIAGLPPPTLLVHSGGGLHVWWLFPEPIVLDDSNRADVAALSSSWHQAAGEQAATLGFHVGNTGDLPRILRIPGTVNRKEGLSRPVRLISSDGPRYIGDQLQAALDGLQPRAQPPSFTQPGAGYATNGPGPFDLIEEHVSFGDLLGPAGWTLVRRERGGAELWRRPGEPSSEYSARAYLNGRKLLTVHSDAAGLPYGPGNSLSVGGLFAHLHHRGDLATGARDLIDAGRGGGSAAARALPRAAIDALAATFPPNDGESPRASQSGQSGQSGQDTHAGRTGRTGPDWGGKVTEGSRRVVLTPASTITLRRVRWAWEDRLPVGELTLLGGREGIGKSLWQADFAARLTRGTLPGEYHGTPRAVVLVATEDDWSMTLAPRLIAAGADLDLVFRADVTIDNDLPGRLTLPLDVARLQTELLAVGAVALFLDPLVSAIDGKLDSHRDAEIRQALDPLASMAHDTRALVQAIVHVGKRDTPDILNAILGSRAFSATARAILAAGRDPDCDQGSCVLSLEKNNLGSIDLPGRKYAVEGVTIDTPEGPTSVGRILDLGESSRRVRDFYGASTSPEERSERGEATQWLREYLEAQDGRESSFENVFRAGRLAGFSERTLRRARQKAGV